MRRFRYKAKDSTGKLIAGEVEARDIGAAAKLVRSRNLFVISIEPIGVISFSFINKIKDRVSGGDVANYTRQLATMINAGLPLTEALLILRTQSKGNLQAISSHVLADVEEGEPLSKAMAKHKVFSKTYIALIKSGEVGGVLDEVLVKLADNLEKQEEFKGKIKSAMIYPILIVVGMIGVGFIMLVFVVPRLTSLYDQFEAELPFSTKLIITLSDTMNNYWPLMLLAVGGVVYGFKLYRKTERGGQRIDELVLKLPLIGPLQRGVIMAELTRTLSLMVSSGVSIIEGLSISSTVVGNRVVSNALDDSVKMVEKGFPVAFAFSKHPEAFPFILSQMVAVGEETGKMDEVLSKVSHVFEVESDRKVKALTSAVEPVILLVLGVGVAFLVISIIMPIYNLTTQI
jgi:type IV pilus assembly protein PilC